MNSPAADDDTPPPSAAMPNRCHHQHPDMIIVYVVLFFFCCRSTQRPRSPRQAGPRTPKSPCLPLSPGAQVPNTDTAPSWRPLPLTSPPESRWPPPLLPPAPGGEHVAELVQGTGLCRLPALCLPRVRPSLVSGRQCSLVSPFSSRRCLTPHSTRVL